MPERAHPSPYIAHVAREEAIRVMAEHEQRHHPADPPHPIPEHLWPTRDPLVTSDERVAASTEELRMITRLLDDQQLSGYTLLTLREGSPWLELDVAVPATMPAPDAGATGAPASVYLGGCVHKFAIWRYTCAAYRVGADGAVEDDPILRPAWRVDG